MLKYKNMSVTGKDEEIQAQLLRAAKQLFELHGFRRVTIDDIAKAIGKARSSLYYYYKTKEEILDAVIAAEISELMTAIEAATSKVQTAEEKIKTFFLTELQIVLGKRGFFNALNAEMEAGEISVYQKNKLAVYQQIRKQEGALLGQIISEGIQRGELNPRILHDNDSLISVLLSSLHGLRREIVILADFSNMESSVQILVHSLIHGLKR
jgi:AcrR family transcriptional regulator